MSRYASSGTLWGRNRGRRRCRTSAWRHARPALEQLECRLALSVGGGWTNSAQSGIVVQPAGAASLVVTGFPTPDEAGVASSFTVTAYDAYGNIATGYTGTVAFASGDSQAGLPASYTFTTGTGKDNGVHTFSATLKTAGTQYLTATDTATSSITGSETGIVVQPGVASLTVTGLPSSMTSGVASNFTVTAYDRYGNIATGYTGKVHFTSTDPSAVLPPDYTFNSGNAGTQSFSTTLNATGTQTIFATDKVTSSFMGSETTTVNPSGGSSATFVKLDATTQGNWENAYGTQGYDIISDAVKIPSYATVTIAGQADYTWTTTSSDVRALQIPGSTNRVGACWDSGTSFTIAVNLNDGQAHDIALYACDFDKGGRAEQIQIISASSGAILDTKSISNFQGGEYLQWQVTGNVIIKVTKQLGNNGILNGLFFDPAATVGPASQLAVSGPTAVTVGSPFNVTVTAEDASGNVATGYSRTVQFASGASLAGLPTSYTFVAADDGTHTFAATLWTAGTQYITATDTTTPSITGTLTGIVVQPAGAASLLIAGFPTPDEAGVASSFTVTAYDAYGNIATGYTGTVVFASGDSQAGLPASYTFTTGTGKDNGVHTFSATLKTAGTQYLTATDTANWSITGSKTGIVVQPVGASSLAVTRLPSSVTPGAASNFTVTAYDPYGNIATGYTGKVHFTSTDPSAVLPPDYTFNSGNAGTQSFSATLNATGTQTIFATDTVTSSITGSETATVNSSGASSATFVKLDSTTQGNWENAYGTQGYDIISDAVSVPSYATVTIAGQKNYTWTTTSSEAQALQIPGSTNRVGACWDSGTSFTIAVNLNDGQAHDIALYACDFDKGGRAEQIQITSASSGAILDTRSISNFQGGEYLQWQVTGNVIITITRQAGPNGILSGLFFDPAVMAGPASQLTVTGPTAVNGPMYVAAGSPFNITVTAKDASGNVATGYRGTIQFTSGDSLAGLPASYTFVAADDGTHTFATTLRTAGAQYITATDTTTPGITGTLSSQSGVGLLGQYYSNSTLSGTPTFTRWDDRADFLWTDGNAIPGGSTDPAFASVGPNNWSAKWTGILTPNFSETYTFVINSAGNGVRLWVTHVGQQQGNPLINDWTYHGQTTDTATMALQVGQDYSVELDYSQTSGSVAQVQLQWSSPSTPLEDIEPVTQVGLDVDGSDNLFANLVNGAVYASWSLAADRYVAAPTDSNLWPEVDAGINLGYGDPNIQDGGSYLVQFNGMATVTNSPETVDWWVNGTDLHTSVLQAGEGYDPSTNTTTATMVVSPIPDPGSTAGFQMTFTNTSRNPTAAPLAITAISDSHGTVTVSVSSVSGIAQNQEVTIAGFTGSAANYNGTYVITSVSASSNTFTYATTASTLPTNPGGGTALVNPENGITNLYVMQPSALGGNTPLPVGTLFVPAALNMYAQYTVLRINSLSYTTADNLTSNWSDRTLVSDNFWSTYTFNSGTGVDTGVSGGAAFAGVPWEVQIALANETGKDVYIDIPINASPSYLTNLADLFAYGSNGVTPYTSPQSDPIWKPLNPNLKVYIELSNEIWNSGYAQAESRWDGWANQLSQRALYDYLTNNQNDPLYPGGGSNAYNDGALLATYYNVNSSNDSAFLGTYNADPAPSTDGASPMYFSNAASVNGYTVGQGWVGLRDVQISNAFKTAFGESNVAAAANNSRVRPVYEWQTGGYWTGALGFIAGTFGAVHPVSYYLYGGGGAFYVSNLVGGFSDVGFANPGFANGLTGWSSSGSAGVVANGSSMGNPNAPPLFSAIAVTNGATESGNTVTITTTATQYFQVGQSVTVSGVVASGYNGTFTVTSVTPTSLTFQDSNVGLASSGDGFVTGTGYSTQTAYLGAGASISQNVTFSGGYADITLYATQNVPTNYSYGLTITLTPTNGGPTINSGQGIPISEGVPNYSISENNFIWDRSQAFYTGATAYTYTVTFTSTLPSGTIFLDNLAIQTVNGMFNETTPALLSTSLNLSSRIETDVAIEQQYGLHDVGYEGGYTFAQNIENSTPVNGIFNGYLNMGNDGYSSSTPNVGMYANLDPRTKQLAIDILDEFYNAGGTLPLVASAVANINTWAVAAPTYYNWDTPKLQAAVAVEQSAQHPTSGAVAGQLATSIATTLDSGPLSSGNRIESIGVDKGGPVDTLNDAGPANLIAPAAAPAMNRGVPDSVRYGTAFDSSQLDAIARVPDTFSYSLAIGTIPVAGLDALSVIFPPADTSDYTTAAPASMIAIKKRPHAGRLSFVGINGS